MIVVLSEHGLINSSGFVQPARLLVFHTHPDLILNRHLVNGSRP
jgi:hypothetical protein